MPALFKGQQLAIVRDEAVIDPQNGKGREIEWNGEKNAIYGVAAGLGTSARVRITQNGPLHVLVATFQNLQDGAPEVATDRWTVRTEVLEKDGFLHPAVNADMEAYNAQVGLIEYRKELEGAVSEGRALISGVAARPIAVQMVRELSRGATHFEDEYIVLRRVRTISAAYTTKMTLFGSRLIYASGQLPVPGNVLFSLPSFPANPPQAQWGWRLRTQESEFVGNKVEQQYEFVLAAWSTLYYSTAGGNFPG